MLRDWPFSPCQGIACGFNPFLLGCGIDFPAPLSSDICARPEQEQEYRVRPLDAHLFRRRSRGWMVVYENSRV
jgi:hypothetical protein